MSKKIQDFKLTYWNSVFNENSTNSFNILIKKSIPEGREEQINIMKLINKK